jgi:hypothetical protein
LFLPPVFNHVGQTKTCSSNRETLMSEFLKECICTSPPRSMRGSHTAQFSSQTKPCFIALVKLLPTTLHFPFLQQNSRRRPTLLYLQAARILVLMGPLLRVLPQCIHPYVLDATTYSTRHTFRRAFSKRGFLRNCGPTGLSEPIELRSCTE